MDGQRTGVWQERAARIFVILACVLGGYLFVTRAAGLILPFLLAFLLAALIRRPAAYLEKKSKLSRRTISVVLLIVLLLLIGMLLFWACRRILLEVQKLARSLENNGELWGRRISEAMDVLSELTSHIPFLSHLKAEQGLSRLWTWMDAQIAQMLSDVARQISSRLPELITSFFRGIPSVAIFLLTFLLSCFYCCADGERITEAMLGWLPAQWKKRLDHSRARLSRVGARYLRAYFLLFVLTFAQLFIGFSFLRLPYTLLPALLISLVDILPLLGAGTVLAPWGVIELLRGNTGLGTGLLALCGIVVALRQISEPRIVGGSIGLHPLATLFAAYVGLGLFGVIGMILGPVAALLIKSFLIKADGQAMLSESLHPPKT